MSDVDELMKEFEISNNTEIWFTDGETWPGMRVNIDEFKAKINRLIELAKLEQIDEIIDIQGRQFNRWTQKDIAHFFERVGVIYRKLSNNLSKGKDND